MDRKVRHDITVLATLLYAQLLELRQTIDPSKKTEANDIFKRLTATLEELKGLAE